MINKVYVTFPSDVTFIYDLKRPRFNSKAFYYRRYIKLLNDT